LVFHWSETLKNYAELRRVAPAVQTSRNAAKYDDSPSSPCPWLRLTEVAQTTAENFEVSEEVWRGENSERVFAKQRSMQPNSKRPPNRKKNMSCCFNFEYDSLMRARSRCVRLGAKARAATQGTIEATPKAMSR